MKPTVPLHEFMPYGAPDLLGAHRSHLSRALMLSSTLALGVLCALGALAPYMRVAPLPTPVIVVPPHDIPNFEVRKALQPLLRVAPRRLPSIFDGVIKPVAEPAEPPVSPDAPPDYDGMSRQLQPGGSSTPAEGRDASIPAVDPDAPATYVEELPVAAFEVKPIYPEIGIETHTQGLVMVLVLVGRDGRVREAKVDEKRHEPVLDDAALAAARQWVFSPALVGGHPVAVWTAIPFRFRLE